MRKCDDSTYQVNIKRCYSIGNVLVIYTENIFCISLAINIFFYTLFKGGLEFYLTVYYELLFNVQNCC